MLHPTMVKGVSLVLEVREDIKEKANGEYVNTISTFIHINLANAGGVAHLTEADRGSVVN